MNQKCVKVIIKIIPFPQLVDELRSDDEVEPAEFYMEQASALQSMTPKGFKQWYHCKEVAAARKEYMKLLSKDGSLHLHHTTSEMLTKARISGDSKPQKFESWLIDFFAILKGRQAYSEELMSASTLSGHQHACCHIIVRPGMHAEFDEWAAKNAPALVGAWRTMLSKNGDLFLVAKMNPLTKQATECYDPAVSRYMIATAAAADEVADEDRGPGSGLTGDQAHPPYCPMRTR